MSASGGTGDIPKNRVSATPPTPTTVCRLRVNGGAVSRDHVLRGRPPYRALLEWARKRLDPRDAAIRFSAVTYADGDGDLVTVTSDDELQLAYAAVPPLDREPLRLLVEIAADDAVVRTYRAKDGSRAAPVEAGVSVAAALASGRGDRKGDGDSAVASAPMSGSGAAVGRAKRIGRGRVNPAWRRERDQRTEEKSPRAQELRYQTQHEAWHRDVKRLEALGYPHGAVDAAMERYRHAPDRLSRCRNRLERDARRAEAIPVADRWFRSPWPAAAASVDHRRRRLADRRIVVERRDGALAGNDDDQGAQSS